MPGSVTSASVQNLQPATSYHLRIIAENRLGQSEPSQLIQVTTTEEGKVLFKWDLITVVFLNIFWHIILNFSVPSGPPIDVRVEAKSSTELIVSWDPPQRDLWNGNILGYYVGFQEVSFLLYYFILFPLCYFVLLLYYSSISSDHRFALWYKVCLSIVCAIFQLNSNSTVLSASGPGGASYTVRTVEGAGMARARTTLSGLQKHAAYAVVVQAYNSRGAGPASPPTTATTMEDGEIILDNSTYLQP